MRRLALAVVAVTVLVVAPLVPVTPGAADEIADKRAEARRISEQLAEQGRRISVLAEEYNEARIASERVQADLDSASSRIATTDAKAGALRRRLKDQAIDSYVHGGAVPAVALLLDTTLEEDISIRLEYVDTITNEIGDTLDDLRAVKLTLEEQRAALVAAKRASTEALQQVESARAQATAAQRAQEELLQKVKGEVAALVAAEERRKAEEQARRAQAELAARRAREAASRQAATTTTARPRTTVAPGAPTTTTTTPASSSSPPPPPAKGAAAAVEEAKRQLGKPYEWGGSGPDSFDCSGLTAWAWKAGGKTLPHSSRSQWSATSRVDLDDIAPGDLLFYGDPIHHVGLYVGDGQMIEAPETGKNVRYASIYRRDYVGAGRVN